METQQTKQNKSRTIAFRITDEQHSRLMEFAREEGYRNLSQWMQQLIRDEIEDRIGDGL